MSNNRKPADWSEVCRRAGGRRHYNARRRLIAARRHFQVVQLLGRFPIGNRGTVRAIARELGVSPSTISRDIARMLKNHRRCPYCGQLPTIIAHSEELMQIYQDFFLIDS